MFTDMFPTFSSHEKGARVPLALALVITTLLIPARCTEDGIPGAAAHRIIATTTAKPASQQHKAAKESYISTGSLSRDTNRKIPRTLLNHGPSSFPFFDIQVYCHMHDTSGKGRAESLSCMQVLR